MNYEEAKVYHKKQWLEGKHKGTNDLYVFPYNLLHQKDKFIIIKIPINKLERQEIDSKRVDKYKQLIKAGKNLGPLWVAYGKKLVDNSVVRFWHTKFYVLDGNHRSEAKRLLNYKEIEVIIPESHYEHYKRIEHE